MTVYPWKNYNLTKAAYFFLPPFTPLLRSPMNDRNQILMIL